MLFYIWVLFSAKQFHYNFNFISGAQYIIHFIDNLAIMAMRFHWIFGFTDDFDLGSSTVFVCAMTISIYCMVSAMCALPLSIIERCFATFYLKDYEINQRPHISYILVILLSLIGVVGAIVLQNKSYTVYVVGILILLNVIAQTLNIFLRRWNKRKYDECHNNIALRFSKIGKYSLAKRFQISENIRSLHMLNIIIYYMGIMNVVLVVSVLFSSFDTTPEKQALCSVVLDGSIFFYSFALPQIMSCFCQKWRVQTNSFKERLGCPKSTSIEPLRDTFGSDMREDMSMNKYFDQLRDSWENA
ncbi:hypothetical protein B9Z55_019961 [Caenorhabditis nigoni]|uniref:Uncharacterized protein n=3 Tax=Caenorhabditis nigoni TaxID=1611254 RepID=A0A2G5TKM6_9PELO|nr:hypothetical protein B9Z55_019961 [Caenorhabditis nigoni]